MNSKLKNKKADVPITILVILVVAVCILAVLSFIYSKKEVQSEYVGVDLIERINSDAEKFYFYINSGFSEEEAAENIGAEFLNNHLVIKRNQTIDGSENIRVEYTTSISGNSD